MKPKIIHTGEPNIGYWKNTGIFELFSGLAFLFCTGPRIVSFAVKTICNSNYCKYLHYDACCRFAPVFENNLPTNNHSAVSFFILPDGCVSFQIFPQHYDDRFGICLLYICRVCLQYDRSSIQLPTFFEYTARWIYHARVLGVVYQLHDHLLDYTK